MIEKAIKGTLKTRLEKKVYNEVLQFIKDWGFKGGMYATFTGAIEVMLKRVNDSCNTLKYEVDSVPVFNRYRNEVLNIAKAGIETGEIQTGIIEPNINHYYTVAVFPNEVILELVEYSSMIKKSRFNDTEKNSILIYAYEVVLKELLKRAKEIEK